MKEKVFYGYKIVHGLPKYVEKVVMDLIKDGWQPFGEMKTIKSNDGVDIIVQCMVLYAFENKDLS